MTDIVGRLRSEQTKPTGRDEFIWDEAADELC
jgi:hypothetical protein